MLNKVINFRLDKTIYLKVMLKADEHNISVSDYLRKIIIEDLLPCKTESKNETKIKHKNNKPA